MRKLRIRSRKPLKSNTTGKEPQLASMKVGDQSIDHTHLQQQIGPSAYLPVSNLLTTHIWEAGDKFWLVLPPSELFLFTWKLLMLPASWGLQILPSPPSETYLTRAFLPQELCVFDQYTLVGQSKLARCSQAVQRPLSWQRSILLSSNSIQPPPTLATKFMYWKALLLK